MSHRSPGYSSRPATDLDRFLSILDHGDVFDGNRRGEYTEVTIGNLERGISYTTFRLPVTKAFTTREALKLVPTMIPYARELIDIADQEPAYRPLAATLLSAMGATFERYCKDPVLFADIQRALHEYGAECTTFETPTKNTPRQPAMAS